MNRRLIAFLIAALTIAPLKSYAATETYDIDNDRTYLLSESAGTSAGLELALQLRGEFAGLVKSAIKATPVAAPAPVCIASNGLVVIEAAPRLAGKRVLFQTELL